MRTFSRFTSFFYLIAANRTLSSIKLNDPLWLTAINAILIACGIAAAAIFWQRAEESL